jgi:hypothetical protein
MQSDLYIDPEASKEIVPVNFCDNINPQSRRKQCISS